jgi:hypothetical protein
MSAHTEDRFDLSPLGESDLFSFELVNTTVPPGIVGQAAGRPAWRSFTSSGHWPDPCSVETGDEGRC